MLESEHIICGEQAICVNYIAQWKILDLLYKISFFFICSLVSIFCYFSAVQWGDMWANPEVMNGKQTIYTDRMKINIKNMKLMNSPFITAQSFRLSL
jgi:hypothetical protein